jgi:hypothetical protein
MRNSNRKSFKDKRNIFENLSAPQIGQLCLSDITFTNLTGFLFLRKGTSSGFQQRISKQMLLVSMKESSLLSQN